MSKYVIITDTMRVIGPFQSESYARGRLAELRIYTDDMERASVVRVEGVRAELRKYKKRGLVVV